MPIVGSFAGASARAYGLGAGIIGPGDFESIQTITAGSAVANIEFTSIPATYTHLQIRGLGKSSSTLTFAKINFNGDTGANYSYHELAYNGVVISTNGANQSFGVFADPFSTSSDTNIFSGFIVDILDYANTNKYKTVRTLSGYDNNSAGYSYLISSNWRSTSAITSIKIEASGQNIAQNSTFALYGVKA
jgi:hypothetical protein